jgi:hypothetical protein
MESTRISEKQPDGEKTTPGQPARVVQFGYSRRMRVMFAAASVLALVGFFTWFFVMNNNTVSGPATAININSELPKVSATEMANYLESIPDDPDIEPISLAGVEEADLDEIMNGINEAELQQFINENPGLLEENMN